MTTRPRRTGDTKKRFQELKKFILEWYDSEDAGGRRVIGKTRTGRAVALVCEDPPGTRNREALTFRKMNLILDETRALGMKKPVEIWADASVAPISGELYIFHQIAVWPLSLPALTHDTASATAKGNPIYQ